MFPIGDDNPRIHTPYATLVLIALNIGAWIFVEGLGHAPAVARALCLHGLVPGNLLGLIDPGTLIPLGEGAACRLAAEPKPLTLLTSMFLHGSWLHIIGNLWFLWVFGDNVEDQLGPVRFLLFYLLCGLAAAGAQIATNPTSTVPMVGASGAIGGVMGAYALLFPRVRVNLLLILGFYVTTVRVPALLMLGYWLLLQLLSGIPALGDDAGGIAFWAHVGGFVAGLVLILPLRIPERRHRKRPQHADQRWF